MSEEIESNKRWYIIHAQSNYEEYVKDALTKRIATAGVEDKFGEILVPKEKVVEMKAGQKRESERKLFPSYVLVQVDMDDEIWHLVRHTPKVLGFIGGKAGKPAPIPAREVEKILQSIQDNVEGKAKPKTMFEIGQVVRVIEGPFADFNGVVEEVNYEKSRLRVAVLIFGRSTPVELEFGQVEKE